MNHQAIDALVGQAQVLLEEYPFDAAHDLAHAKAVWATAKDIAQHLASDPGSGAAFDPGSYPTINLDSLKIACFWHDVVVKPVDKLHPAGENVADTANFLKQSMQSMQFPTDFINTTYLAVRYHQYDDTPKNLEGQILWDADKLNVISLDRWLEAKTAVDAGKMPPEKLESYLKTGLKWLKTLRVKFHLNYSRELYDHRAKSLISDPQAQRLAQTMNLDLNTLFN